MSCSMHIHTSEEAVCAWPLQCLSPDDVVCYLSYRPSEEGEHHVLCHRADGCMWVRMSTSQGPAPALSHAGWGFRCATEDDPPLGAPLLWPEEPPWSYAPPCVKDAATRAMQAIPPIAPIAPIAPIPPRDNGFHAAPARYATGNREEIDVWRDMAYYVADRDRDSADLLFAFACATHANKYRTRAGSKGDPEGDEEKRRFYAQMAEHVTTGSPDPRSNRPGFTPYTYPNED